MSRTPARWGSLLSPSRAAVLHQDDRDGQYHAHGQHDPYEGHVGCVLNCHGSRVRGGALRRCGPSPSRSPVTPTTTTSVTHPAQHAQDEADGHADGEDRPDHDVGRLFRPGHHGWLPGVGAHESRPRHTRPASGRSFVKRVRTRNARRRKAFTTAASLISPADPRRLVVGERCESPREAARRTRAASLARLGTLTRFAARLSARAEEARPRGWSTRRTGVAPPTTSQRCCGDA